VAGIVLTDEHFRQAIEAVDPGGEGGFDGADPPEVPAT